VRALLPIAIFLAALAALLLTPETKPILGLPHGQFAGAGMGAAMIGWVLLTGLARVGAAGAARVVGGAATWALIFVALVALYGYRDEFADIADRVIAELSPSTPQIGPTGEVTIRRRHGGEFIVSGKVNNRPVEFVFDTGASSVVLSAEDAVRAGLSLDGLDFDTPVTTANGSATAAPVRLDTLAVGPIVVGGVRALVARPGALNESLLGMSFLERLKGYSVEGGRLVLRGK
jgi:aspartyl protease family protein